MNTLIDTADKARSRAAAETSRLDEFVDDHDRRGGAGHSLLPIFVGSVAVGIAIVAVVGVRLSRGRKPKTPVRWAVDRAEDAREALMDVAGALPDRGRAAIRRVRRR